MPKTVELIVSLKVPDTTAITALQTLNKMGFKQVINLKRLDYYRFFIDGDAQKFKQKISKTDLIVNANKHFCGFSVPKTDSVKLLVKNSDDNNSGLLKTLKNRLGFKELKKIEKFVLWEFIFGSKSAQNRKAAENAAKDLLVNEHYQEYKIL
ncbi:MAG TPA: hypothetical protein VI564_06670 [Candidatus Nanoarchaeia archaeon]|nr:hypothetical protein [Candidatus Nanoarchaeia archaeon]